MVDQSMNSPGGVTFDFDVIRLSGPGVASPFDDQLLEKRLHLFHTLGFVCGEVVGLSEVIGQVVELDGL